MNVVGWDEPDEAWHAARRRGISASDVAALLGFDRYCSPWQLWAQKTGHPMAPVDRANDAAQLGHLLEHWLLTTGLRQTLGADGFVFPHRLYAHASYPWRLSTPDGYCYPDPAGRVELVETKTAGLATGRTRGWTDTTIPLGYELQARWQMHVMDAEVCHVVALVAGRGLCHYPIRRELDLEDDLVDQVTAWYERHIVGGEEPPLTGRDAAVVASLYPKVERKTVVLDDTDALMHWRAYRDAHQDLVDAEERKAEAATALKVLLGDAHTGLVEGRPLVTWGERRGRVDWEAIARELYGLLGDALDVLGDVSPVRRPARDLDALAEQRRGPTTRTFNIKE